MKRDVVAPMRKAKIPIPAAKLVDELKSSRYREFRDFCRNPSNFGNALSK